MAPRIEDIAKIYHMICLTNMESFNVSQQMCQILREMIFNRRIPKGYEVYEELLDISRIYRDVVKIKEWLNFFQRLMKLMMVQNHFCCIV